MNIHKNRQQCTSKPNPTIHEKIVHHDQVELRDVKIFSIFKSNQHDIHINKMKKKNYMIIWIDPKKAFEKFHHL